MSWHGLLWCLFPRIWVSGCMHGSGSLDHHLAPTLAAWALSCASGLLGASLVAQTVKNLPAMQQTWVWSLGWEDPLEGGMATHPSILAWRIPWTEEATGLQSIGSQKVRQQLKQLNTECQPRWVSLGARSLTSVIPCFSRPIRGSDVYRATYR